MVTKKSMLEIPFLEFEGSSALHVENDEKRARTERNIPKNLEIRHKYQTSACTIQKKVVPLRPNLYRVGTMSPKTAKDITEQSEVIQKARRAVAAKVTGLDDINPVESPLSEVCDWKDKPFSFPDRTIRIGTLFSGIGAIEHAFQRLKLNTQIVFAGDN